MHALMVLPTSMGDRPFPGCQARLPVRLPDRVDPGVPGLDAPFCCCLSFIVRSMLLRSKAWSAQKKRSSIFFLGK